MTNIPILNARIEGSGPVIVLLHGFLASSEYWKEVSRLSATKHKVIALDLLGFGKSPKPRKSRYDYEAHIESIKATLEHHNVTTPFTLVGHSMGALIALRYARLHAPMVNKLVLTNMPITLGYKQVRDEIINTSFTHRYGLMPYLHRPTWTVFKTLYRLRLLSRHTIRRLKANKYFFQHSPLSRIRSFQRVISTARTDIDLNLVRVRTLLLSGLEDRRVYLDNLNNNISLSPTVAIENLPTGHHIPCVMPKLFLTKVSE